MSLVLLNDHGTDADLSSELRLAIKGCSCKGVCKFLECCEGNTRYKIISATWNLK